MKLATRDKAAVEKLRLAAAGIDLQVTGPKPWVTMGTAFLTGFFFAYFPSLRRMLPGAMAGFASRALTMSGETSGDTESRE